jgi:hypothetical protein
VIHAIVDNYVTHSACRPVYVPKTMYGRRPRCKREIDYQRSVRGPAPHRTTATPSPAFGTRSRRCPSIAQSLTARLLFFGLTGSGLVASLARPPVT